MKKGIMTMIAVMLVTALPALARDNNAEIASIRKELSQTKTRKDSIKLLYDIYDLSERKNYPAVLKELDAVATREGDVKTRLDVVRHLANVYSSDSLLNVLEKHAMTFPVSDDQKETLMFVKMRRLRQHELYGNANESHDNIAKIIAVADTASMDKYDRVFRAFTICEYLGIYAPGSLLTEYLEELEEELNKVEFKSPVLQHFYLQEVANIYTGIGDTKKAVEADKKLLDLIDNTEQTYRAKGRTYRNYDRHKFVIYRRMLSNYPALSLEEANDIYDKAMEIVAVNADAAANYNKHKRIAIYHAMKNERYAEALAALKKSVPVEDSKIRKRHLLEMMIEAAEKTGDTATAESAKKQLDELNALLSSEESKQKYNELDVRYQISSLKAENAELELESKNEQIANSQRSMILISVLWIVFALFIVVALIYWTRYRRVMTNLQTFIDSVGEERDNLKKRRYYDYNLTEYSQQPEREGMYQKVLGKRENSTTMLNKVLEDLFFVSSISMEDTRKYRQTIKVGKLMEECVETVTANLHRNLNVNVNYPEPDFDIRVDKECLQKLIDQILNKAAQLAPDGGSIGFACSYDETAKMARFVFKHSGAGLPYGEEERIFDGFFNMGTENGKGKSENILLVCRMVSFLCRCSLKSSSGRANVSGGQLVLMVPLD